MKPYISNDRFVDDDDDDLSFDLFPAEASQALPPPYPGILPLQTSSSSSLAPSSLYDHFEESEGEAIPPSYSNSIYLRAIMPRKMELSAPGVRANDRKWRKVLCELDGTAFRVYECATGWWEDKIGVGDARAHGSTTFNPSGIGRVTTLSQEETDASLTCMDHSVPRSSFTKLQTQKESRLHYLESSNTSTSSLETTPSSKSDHPSSPSHIDFRTPDAPSPLSLLKTYTLQQCELGVARYYPKRNNVIRFRMEGEQFLLQAMNTSEVIQWIEGFQAAINIALDIDQRCMPPGPIYPRYVRFIFLQEWFADCGVEE